jgi:hypothetical protein
MLEALFRRQMANSYKTKDRNEPQNKRMPSTRYLSAIDLTACRYRRRVLALIRAELNGDEPLPSTRNKHNWFGGHQNG